MFKVEKYLCTLLTTIVATVLFASSLASSFQDNKCVLTALDPTLSSICGASFTGTSLDLTNCQLQQSATSEMFNCSEFVPTNSQICEVYIGLTNMVTHAPLFAKRNCSNEPTRYIITIMDIRDETFRQVPLFRDVEKMHIEELSLISSQVSQPLGKLFEKNGRHLRVIKITNLSSIEAPMATGQFDSLRMGDLIEINIKDSVFQGIQEKAFEIHHNVERISMNNVAFGKFIHSQAINIHCSGTKSLNISIKNSPQSARLETKDSFLGFDNETCSSSQADWSLKLDIDGFALFGRAFPEAAFGHIVKKALEGQPGVQIEFKYDKIGCCSAGNRWLFRMLDEYSKFNRSSSLSIGCHNFNATIADYMANKTEFESRCPRKDTYSILIIIIVIIGLLTIFLGIFSCVFYFYVLPKRDNIITINPTYPTPSKVTGVTHIPADASKELEETKSVDSKAHKQLPLPTAPPTAPVRPAAAAVVVATTTKKEPLHKLPKIPAFKQPGNQQRNQRRQHKRHIEDETTVRSEPRSGRSKTGRSTSVTTKLAQHKGKPDGKQSASNQPASPRHRQHQPHQQQQQLQKRLNSPAKIKTPRSPAFADKSPIEKPQVAAAPAAGAGQKTAAATLTGSKEAPERVAKSTDTKKTQEAEKSAGERMSLMLKTIA